MFIWGGFVRSGVGFGGAALTLPILLLIYEQPLFFLPIIAVQLLFFGTINLISELHLVDWRYLGKLLLIIAIPKLTGVFGLLELPKNMVLIIIYGITFFHAINYLSKRYKLRKSKFAEYISLLIGGYTSGTSLSGAPALVPVIANHVSKHRLRSTLFALWTILVSIKLSAFVLTGISLQLEHQLWLMPAAAMGHFIGLIFHRRIQQTSNDTFYQIIGLTLLILSILGLFKIDW